MKEQNTRDTESHISAILEQTPNGVLLVDSEIRIKYVNPAFREMFQCKNSEMIGNIASKYIFSDCFERAIAAGGRLIIKETCTKLDVSYRVGLFPIEEENLYCGIFIDISNEERAKKHFRELRAQTLQRAQEVISRQMQTAQEIARLLGETTAETKILLVKLMSLFKEEID
ncbi:MAG: PAS domain-containing protein [Spirochaetales bacterium]|nr:PAS domain-containing protein [Spirochaetales bacterium]